MTQRSFFHDRISQEPTKDDQCTPESILKPVRSFKPITLDCCANEWSINLGFVSALEVWTKSDDCLSKPNEAWSSHGDETMVWFQPPYSDPKPFVTRLADAYHHRRFDCVGLVRNDTSTEWWDMIECVSASIGTVHDRVHCYWGYEQRGSTNFSSMMFHLTRHKDRGSALRDVIRLNEVFSGIVRWWPRHELAEKDMNDGSNDD